MDWHGVHLMIVCTLMGLGTIFCDPTKVGPYDVRIYSASGIGPKSGRGIFLDPKIRKYNRSLFVVSSPFNATIDLDDSLNLLVDMAVQTGNGWKEHFLKQSFTKACSSIMSYAGSLFTMLLKKIGAKVACPLQKGYYTIKEMPLVVDIHGVPVFWYGKYKFKIFAFEKGHDPIEHNVMGIEALVDVAPKTKH